MATRSERRYGVKTKEDSESEKTPDSGESTSPPKDSSEPAKGPKGKRWKTKKDMKKGTES